MTSDLDRLFALIALGFLVYISVVIFERTVLRRRKQKGPVATPVTAEGLTQYDELPPGLAVTLAWSEPGINPHYHRMMQDDIRAQMPVLARALDRMVEE